MAVDCCNLVGKFPISIGGCIISIEYNTSTEVSKAGNTIIIGPTVGTITITGYATNVIYTGCPGRASVQINWVRNYDCDKDIAYFIWAGAGKSSIYGGTGSDRGHLDTYEHSDLAYILEGLDKINPYTIVRADSGSGPTSIYTLTPQQDGYGLAYTGGPFPFNTNTEEGATFINHGIGTSPWYLQNFNVDLAPGTIPRATYSFMYVDRYVGPPCT